MTKAELYGNIQKKSSFLCVGLDTDIQKIPKYLLKSADPVFEFNKYIIDVTHKLAVAYKPNIAFYEAMGVRGWESLQRTLEFIPKECFTIADAKRGDIGNTSSLYARAFFDKEASGMSFDSVTVAPYMGQDSVEPFLQFKDKWVILLALTSNEGSQDFQLIENHKGEALFETVLKKSQNWGSDQNLMYVVGATQGKNFQIVREHAPAHFLLVPGVGAQGGSLSDVAQYGMNKDCGLLVNASRSIIYASDDEEFAKKAKKEAENIQLDMARMLDRYMR